MESEMVSVTQLALANAQAAASGIGVEFPFVLRPFCKTLIFPRMGRAN